jgi:hypothetical protein
MRPWRLRSRQLSPGWLGAARTKPAAASAWAVSAWLSIPPPVPCEMTTSGRAAPAAGGDQIPTSIDGPDGSGTVRRWKLTSARASEALSSRTKPASRRWIYVRVHTARGSSMVLATFAQAIAALGGSPGLRVHRLWWVAEAAVAGVAADGRNLRLVLTNGLAAPVARASVAAVRQAVWLERRPAASASDSVIA